MGSKLTEKAKLYIQKVHSASDRMVTMIEGVLAYSTVTAGNQRTEWVNLNEVIHSIEEDLEVIIQQKEASIRMEEFPPVQGSAVLLYQLFYNLMVNALKFSKAGEKPVIIFS